jgi:uncharacterized protein YndB with AHSA1/START domain
LHNATDRIEKEIVLRAPQSRVWRALANAEEFGTWFGMKLEGTFAPGGRVHDLNGHLPMAGQRLTVLTCASHMGFRPTLSGPVVPTV